MAELIRMCDINNEATTQTRVTACQDTIEAYADAMRDAFEFPPIEVYFDGETYWIADGWHRFWAAYKAGFEEIEANVTEGGEMEAILAGCGANASHGLRRTNEDKRHAVRIVLETLGHWDWSDRMVAESCAVSPPTVARVRKDLESQKLDTPQVESTVKVLQLSEQDGEAGEESEEHEKRLGKDGKSRKAPQSVVDEILGEVEEAGEEGDTLEDLAEPTKHVRQNLIQTKKDIKGIAEWHPYVASALSRFEQMLSELAGAMRQNTAESWCPVCSGEGCQECNNCGWLTLYASNQRER